jgi:hypothetical protein
MDSSRKLNTATSLISGWATASEASADYSIIDQIGMGDNSITVSNEIKLSYSLTVDSRMVDRICRSREASAIKHSNLINIGMDDSSCSSGSKCIQHINIINIEMNNIREAVRTNLGNKKYI